MADHVLMVEVAETKVRRRPDSVTVVISDSVIANHILERPRTVHAYPHSIGNAGGAGSSGTPDSGQRTGAKKDPRTGKDLPTDTDGNVTFLERPMRIMVATDGSSDARTATTSGGLVLRWDELVLATGSIYLIADLVREGADARASTL